MKHKLTRLNSSHRNLRTDSVEGTLVVPPQVGGYLELHGAPLTEGMDVRVVTTSWIKSIEHTEQGMLITTQNSTYLLETLPT